MDFHDGGSNVTWIAGFVLEDLSAVGIGLNKTEVLIKLKKMFTGEVSASISTDIFSHYSGNESGGRLTSSTSRLS